MKVKTSIKLDSEVLNEIELINQHAGELNHEAEEVLGYQEELRNVLNRTGIETRLCHPL